MHYRGQLVIEQSIASAGLLADALALHKIWLESDGQQGSRADLSDEKFVGNVLCDMNFEPADLRRADFSSADLRNADLNEALSASTDPRGADFSGADLTGISMRNCNAGPSAKGLAEALTKVAKRDRPPYVRND